jgi:hypothetical protein
MNAMPASTLLGGLFIRLQIDLPMAYIRIPQDE